MSFIIFLFHKTNKLHKGMCIFVLLKQCICSSSDFNSLSVFPDLSQGLSVTQALHQVTIVTSSVSVHISFQKQVHALLFTQKASLRD